jgi:hypothetical protein
MPVRTSQDKSSESLIAHMNNIERILSMIDVNPTEARAHSIDGFRWVFQWGSAGVEVNVVERGKHGYFQVSSPLVYLPQDNLEQLYRRLLEYNWEMTNVAFAVHGDVVYVVSERPLNGMDTEEARYIITQVAYYADDLDNKLADEFGTRLYE